MIILCSVVLGFNLALMILYVWLMSLYKATQNHPESNTINITVYVSALNDIMWKIVLFIVTTSLIAGSLLHYWR